MRYSPELATEHDVMESGHSDQVTEGIRVRVSAQFMPDESDADRRQFVFVYRVLVSNEGTEWAKLVSRRWEITDANGEVELVEGPGVVGEQPELAPGDEHEYRSYCPLRTHWGTMEGHYVMQREDGSTFEARIGRFFLSESTRLAQS